MTDEESDGQKRCQKRKNPCPQKNLKRLWLREIFKKKAVDGFYNNLVHELQNEDRKFCFK